MKIQAYFLIRPCNDIARTEAGDLICLSPYRHSTFVRASPHITEITPP